MSKQTHSFRGWLWVWGCQQGLRDFGLRESLVGGNSNAKQPNSRTLAKRVDEKRVNRKPWLGGVGVCTDKPSQTHIKDYGM